MDLSQNLHITNPSIVNLDRTSATYDKMLKVGWVLNSIKNKCIEQWNAGLEITIDDPQSKSFETNQDQRIVESLVKSLEHSSNGQFFH